MRGGFAIIFRGFQIILAVALILLQIQRGFAAVIIPILGVLFGASQYNYGFGAKLQFDFTLTEDGNVVVKDASGNNTTVPIKFFFSGGEFVV